MMSDLQFHTELIRCVTDYRTTDDWFVNRREQQPTVARPAVYLHDRLNIYLRMAYSVYKNVYRNALDVIFLGDTRIRLDQENLMNFGIVSSTVAPQDDEAKEMVDKANKDCEELDKVRPGEGLYSFDRRREHSKPITVTEVGSILSAEGWSPMMNDALVIAGAERHTDFVYMLAQQERKRGLSENQRAKEQSTFRKIGERPQNQALFDVDWGPQRERNAKQLWIDFFNEVPTTIWNLDVNCPRVFARELLGLELFGYKPVFDFNQISFHYDAGLGGRGLFRRYLDRLREVSFGMTGPVRRGLITRRISNFLFGDPAAVGTAAA